MSQEALIENALKQILGVWQVEAKDVRDRGPKGFDWLPGSHLVSVRAVPFDPKDPTYLMLQGMGGANPRERGVRLSVTTRLITDFPIKSLKAVELINVMAPMLSSTYSLVYPPRAFVEAANAPEGPYDLELFSSVYIDPNLVGWLPSFFAQMAIMQPIDAEVRGHRLPEMLGGGLPAFEDGRKREELDDILEVADQIFAPAGARQSRWSGTDEFKIFAQNFGGSNFCFANGDPTGLTAEVAFGSGSALIQCRTNQAHPRLGNGLLVTLMLPHNVADQPDGGVADFNFFEARAWTEVPKLGCWHSRDAGRERGIFPSHSTFVPNALYRPGLIQNFVFWEIGRARWVRETFFPDMQDMLLPEILNARFKGGSNIE